MLDEYEHIAPASKAEIVGTPHADSATDSSRFAGGRIVKTPGICGGNARIAGTRLAVWSLAASRMRGCPDERFLELYPWLNPADLQAAWLYAERNQDEIHNQIEGNMSA